jgi:hypothetical protein
MLGATFLMFILNSWNVKNSLINKYRFGAKVQNTDFSK